MNVKPAWPESRFISIGGARHHYVASGDAGPTVVFLHGYGDSWRSFEPLLPAFGDGFRILVLDQRGHGRTAETESYAIADFTGDAIAFIGAIASGPVHLVGHSLGAIVALRLAERRPDLLRSLTVIGGAPTAAGNATLTAVRAELAELGDDITDDFIAAFQTSGFAAPVRLRRRALVADSRRLTARTWRGALDGLLTEPYPDERAPAGLPALSLWGARDGIFNRGAQVALMRAAPHIEAIHYAGVGHSPHWEIADQVASDLVRFIQSVEGDVGRAETAFYGGASG
ncbi:hydrolase [Methylopila jiangsuensis]|uniref:Hydrolase n=1 Tax=Methylopila jiangsuensis TaxID=586230 RepID=A0A9W6JHG8_9HYPH|nr:alpha/beta hydrolase [Methylopila jiangsuensis]MDR6284896.1 pimeloyl-ACP methyl ester carboxylesterase [Methylopila jiangsuensis]GLK77716.1 hydrolase [Methylopila jiangsuensis]